MFKSALSVTLEDDPFGALNTVFFEQEAKLVSEELQILSSVTSDGTIY